MLKPVSLLFAAGFLFLAAPGPSHAAPKSDGLASQVAPDTVSARRRSARRHAYPRYRVRAYYAPKPFKYYYGPGYRLWWGHPHAYGPQSLMWPYDSAPYPYTTFGFGTW